MMACMQWMNGFLICVLAYNAYCLTINSAETRELYLILNKDGSLTHSSKIPDCGKGGKIHLIAYSYQKRQCNYECYSTHEDRLLPDDELRLHEMCSLRRRCRNMSFSFRSAVQRNTTNSVYLKYQCLDDSSTTVDICDGTTTSFNDTVYLISSSIARHYKECFCYVNSGYFSVKLEDVRLNLVSENICSLVLLRINAYDFSCKADRRDFGSIFNRTIENSILNAYILLKPNSTADLPNMIFLTLKPKDTAKITCSTKPSRSRPVTVAETASAKPTVVVSVVQELSTYGTFQKVKEVSSPGTCTNDCSVSVLAFATTVSVMGVLLIVLTCVIVVIRWKERLFCFKKTKKQSDQQRSERLNLPIVPVNTSPTMPMLDIHEKDDDNPIYFKTDEDINRMKPMSMACSWPNLTPRRV